MNKKETAFTVLNHMGGVGDRVSVPRTPISADLWRNYIQQYQRATDSKFTTKVLNGAYTITRIR